jgi:hypothetical protein
MQVFIRHDPKYGKYAVFKYGSRAPMPEKELDKDTLDIWKAAERREGLDRLYAVAPRLFL